MATPKADYGGLSKEQLDLIQQFEADYNAIDGIVRAALKRDKQASFVHLVNEYLRRHPMWNGAELLRTIAEIRNAIVHEKQSLTAT